MRPMDMIRHANYTAALAAAELPEGAILNLDKTLLYNILIQFFNIVVLIVALTAILYKPVKKFLADRRQRINDEAANVHRIREEAEQLREKYEKMIEGIGAERDEILSRANRIAVEKSDRLLFEAQHEAEALHMRTRSDIETEYKNMENEIKRQIIEISHLMASRFVELSIGRETQDQLIEQALSEYDGIGPNETA